MGGNTLIKWFYRKPDFEIGEPGDLYLRRWWIIPKNKYFNIYLHHFLKSDEDRALHDHPWWSLGMILKGYYKEIMPKNIEDYISGKDRTEILKHRRRFQPVFRKANHIHRVELYDMFFHPSPKPVWTLFITGPKIRDWGFWCPKGFRPWEKFVDVREGGNAVGKGCED